MLLYASWYGGAVPDAEMFRAVQWSWSRHLLRERKNPLPQD